MTTAANKPLGTFVSFDALDGVEQELVKGTWLVADNAYIPRSNFPVGAVILAENDIGETKVFPGCNVEGRFFPSTICAERNAGTTAVAQGYRKFLKVAIVCKNYQGPGSSPCGLCRQVLTEFGRDCVVLGMADKSNNIVRYSVAELLPAASGEIITLAKLSAADRRLVKRVEQVRDKSYVPYSKSPAGAIFIAKNDSGHKRHFPGASDDNASYGGSALAACVAMRSARTAGYSKDVTLAVTVSDLKGHNPVEGECLQVLREFGLDGKVILVGKDSSVVFSSLVELLPDSFGPSSLK